MKSRPIAHGRLIKLRSIPTQGRVPGQPVHPYPLDSNSLNTSGTTLTCSTISVRTPSFKSFKKLTHLLAINQFDLWGAVTERIGRDDSSRPSSYLVPDIQSCEQKDLQQVPPVSGGSAHRLPTFSGRWGAKRNHLSAQQVSPYQRRPRSVTARRLGERK